MSVSFDVPCEVVLVNRRQVFALFALVGRSIRKARRLTHAG